MDSNTVQVVGSYNSTTILASFLVELFQLLAELSRSSAQYDSKSIWKCFYDILEHFRTIKRLNSAELRESSAEFDLTCKNGFSTFLRNVLVTTTTIVPIFCRTLIVVG